VKSEPPFATGSEAFALITLSLDLVTHPTVALRRTGKARAKEGGLSEQVNEREWGSRNSITETEKDGLGVGRLRGGVALRLAGEHMHW